MWLFDSSPRRLELHDHLEKEDEQWWSDFRFANTEINLTHSPTKKRLTQKGFRPFPIALYYYKFISNSNKEFLYVLGLLIHHHQSVLPKGRSFTASAGTKAAVLPPQTQEPGLQFYWVWISSVASRCFPHNTLSLASEQTLKDLKRSQGHQRGGEEGEFG